MNNFDKQNIVKISVFVTRLADYFTFTVTLMLCVITTKITHIYTALTDLLKIRRKNLILQYDRLSLSTTEAIKI